MPMNECPSEALPSCAPPHLPRALLSGLLIGVSLLLSFGELRGQSIRGRVIDVENQTGIANVDIAIWQRDREPLNVLTDALGDFSVALERTGEYWLRASALGYAVSDSSMVRLTGDQELVDVVMRLSTEPIDIEGLTISARGLELRHRASFEGFLVRHEDALSVGSARVFSSEDPEVRSAGNVRDVLRWVPFGRARCVVVYIDGRVVRNVEVGSLSARSTAGIEFYLWQNDAPLEFRGGGPPCTRAVAWSVLVIWRG